ncbi:hypothetical protein FALBO_16221 [Fusarium albosuccineum]|uniref:Uncharacterized protein n=1 Tax=Fusarium albosuccineum TaxID=1237068 RepID=A0A8H4KKY8_9HYPO|nr:hypothetical protein FALBO_16221 [Fusarium albosuccineum]
MGSIEKTNDNVKYAFHAQRRHYGKKGRGLGGTYQPEFTASPASYEVIACHYGHSSNTARVGGDSNKFWAATCTQPEKRGSRLEEQDGTQRVHGEMVFDHLNGAVDYWFARVVDTGIRNNHVEGFDRVLGSQGRYSGFR